MNNQQPSTLHKKSIIRKTIEVGSSTLVSRVLGIAREVLLARFLGAGAISDAFITAFKIPNSMRKVFAEGALSVALIPTFVKVMKEDGKHEVNRLVTLSFLVFEGILFVLCLFIFFKADWIIRIIAPGWYQAQIVEQITYAGIPFVDGALNFVTSSWDLFWSSSYGNHLEQVTHAVSFLRILISFIVFLSSSSLLAAALQSVNHFFVPAFSPILINIIWIAGILFCMLGNFPVHYMCFFLLAASFAQFLLHISVYLQLNFGFGAIDKQSWQNFKAVLKKFLPCFFSMSVMEINLFIATTLASYLPKGSISLIYYANRFMGVPLGVFALAFSTILLPHFSRISTYAPQRLSFYLLEATKFIFWVTIPFTLLMSFVAEKIFLTMFLSDKFSLAQVFEARNILIAYVIGLFFFSLNKILLNLFYSLHETKIPLYISLFAVVSYYSISKISLPLYGAMGLAMANVASAMLQSLLFVLFLHTKYDFKLYGKQFMLFLSTYLVNLTAIAAIFIAVYAGMVFGIAQLPESFAHFFLYKIGFWLWVGPLSGVCMLLLYFSRPRFNVKLHFLD
jgi:putative peptidoglycan lipid II flippase